MAHQPALHGMHAQQGLFVVPALPSPACQHSTSGAHVCEQAMHARSFFQVTALVVSPPEFLKYTCYRHKGLMSI